MRPGRAARKGTTLLAAVGLAACARQGQPAGGPEDQTPPVVAATRPDTFSVMERGQEPVLIRFSERISERPSEGSLDDAVEVSPRTGDVRVRHERDGLKVTVRGGFLPGLVYGVTVRAVIRDMFGNPLLDDFEFFFSTGAGFHSTVVAGLVTDRITGKPIASVRVDAAPLGLDEEGIIYTSMADTAGIFALRYLPPGGYRLMAYEDQNRNRRVDEYEPQNSRRIDVETPADTLLTSLAVLTPDTTPASLRQVEIEDSLALRLTFTDYLDPALALEGVAVVVRSGDEEAVEVARVMHEHAFTQMNRARADSADAAAAIADGREPPTRDQGDQESEPPLPKKTLIVLLAEPLTPGTTYNVEVSGLRNIAGTANGGGSRELELPPAEEPDAEKPDSAKLKSPARGGR